jgi:hypothetical protein
VTFDHDEFDKCQGHIRELVNRQKEAIDKGDEATAIALGREIAEPFEEGDWTRKLLDKANEIAKKTYGESFEDMNSDKEVH